MDKEDVERRLACFCNDCPYLQEESDDASNIDARCTKYNVDLIFYDWWWKCDECYDGTYEGRR